jgi:molybdate transport system substrate-binding protein
MRNDTHEIQRSVFKSRTAQAAALFATIIVICVLGSSVAHTSRASAADKDPLDGKVLLMVAASTIEAINEVRTEFVRLHPAVTVRINAGASSTLAQQINAGAEADLFLSANVEWADFVHKKKLAERQRDLLGNELVVVVPADSKLEITEPADLVQSKIRRLALADPKSVPAGIYARQVLEKLKLWEQLESRTTGAADVRQALRFVETGVAEAGIVYATDAATSKSVKVAARIAPKLSEPIRYPLVLLKHGADNPDAVALYDFLGSPAASEVFRRHGFIVPAASDKTKP